MRPNAAKTFMLRARVTVVENVAIESLARYEGLTRSEVLRLSLREACKRRAIWPLDTSASDLNRQTEDGS